MNSKPSPKLKQGLGLILMFAIMASLALVLNGSIFGYRPGSVMEAETTGESERFDGDKIIINTSAIGKGITGYAGPVPVEIYISHNRVDSIHALPNEETPGFFNRVVESDLLESWDGLSVEEAVTIEVDAVSGATYSSGAVIANVRAGLNKVLEERNQAKEVKKSEGISAVMICVWIVLLAGALLPLFIKNRIYRIIQQFLNVGVLGFWSGTFLDYAMMLKVFSHGLPFTIASITTYALLILGFIYPLFGKTSYYCTWICPLGSLQELVGSIMKYKVRLRKGVAEMLENFKQLLWVVLLLLLWTGFGATWIDYELFTAFIVKSAAWSVIGVGIAIIIISIFIMRPFCRFVCPMGTLLHKADGTDM